MAENWYIVLGLDFDPPVEDEAVIAAKIEERSRFWSTHFNDFKMGANYRAWHQNIPQIKKDMIGPANIRKQLAADACTEVYGPVDKLLKTIGRKGSITDDEVDKMAKKMKLSVDVIKKRAKALGIKIAAAPVTNYQDVYDKYYKNKPQNAATFDNLQPMLAAFKVSNLYEFLYIGTTIKNASSLPCDALRQRAAELKKTVYYKNDSVSGTGAKLCAQCEMSFKDDAAKAVYDAYLEYMRRKTILDEAKNIAEISGELQPEQADDFIGRLTQIFRDRKLAEEVLTAFCKVEKIAYNPKGAAQTSANIKVCRCGCMNDVSDGRKVCQNCGLELVIRCPKCKAENDASVKVCKCGFKFENIDKATSLCELAEHAMEALEFKVAEAHLTDADRYWPGSSKVAALRKQLAEYQQRVGKEVAKMQQAMQNKNYMDARQQYAAIRKLFPNYSDPVTEELINKAIIDAQNAFRQAQASKVEQQVLDLCAKAYELCADLPGVKELMSKYPPHPVTDFKVSVNPGTRSNVISWAAKAGDSSIRYRVIRSKNGWIQHPSDGEQIYQGSASSYCDKSIEPGVVYYYNVFAERAGILSKGATGEMREAVNLFEISNVAIAAADGSLNLTWDTLPKNATAEIYQINANGLEKRLASSASDRYLVSGLTNDTAYRYRVALSYIVGGKKQETRGTIVVGTPTCPPMPVDTLRVKPAPDGSFEAVWYYDGPGDVRLFCSTKKPQYLSGDVVSLAALEREMDQLQHRPLSNATAQKLKPNEKGVSFLHNSTELLYVVAVVVKSGTAVFGTLSRASKGETFNIKTVRVVNGKISISLEPPKGATGFVVLYRHDQFPTDISDTKTVRKYIPYKNYQLNSALLLDSPDEKKYYFSVFAEFKRDGEVDYSSGADYLFDNSAKVNITYSISVQKRIFGASTVVLEFEADQRSFTLPDIDIMSAVGNTPMFKASAQLFHQIPSQEVNGSVAIRIPMPNNLPRDTYIKAFFQDEAQQSGNQLRLKLKSNYKIN